MDGPGKRIAAWRERLQKTHKQFEELTGIPYTTLKTIEKGTVKPSYDVIVKLRNAFPQLNIEWLFDEGKSEPMLREGRTLTPIPTEQRPDPDPPTTEPKGFGADVEVTVLRRLLADRDEQLERKDEKIAELNRSLGKPFNGLDAAGLPSPQLPAPQPIGFRLSVSHRVKGKGTARPL